MYQVFPIYLSVKSVYFPQTAMALTALSLPVAGKVVAATAVGTGLVLQIKYHDFFMALEVSIGGLVVLVFLLLTLAIVLLAVAKVVDVWAGKVANPGRAMVRDRDENR